MASPWEIQIFDGKELAFTRDIDGPVELGRQSENEPGPYVARQQNGRCRIIVARSDEVSISRQHLLVEPLPENQTRVRNLSKIRPVWFPDNRELRPGESCIVPVPAFLSLGRRSVRIEPIASEDDAPLQSLAEAAAAPGQAVHAHEALGTLVASVEGPWSTALVHWLRAVMEVLHSAAGSLEFFQRAARAVVELVGMDAGRVLLRTDGGWTVQAQETAPHGNATAIRRPSGRILGRMLQQKRTFWRGIPWTEPGSSLTGVEAVVAAPILDRHGEVIGALYGDRGERGSDRTAPPISGPEAMLVELLAGGVAAGLARVEQEQALLRARVQFEQFFTPELSRYLESHPDLLQGRDAEVSVLFCDIRAFSRSSERLGPAKTFDWIGDVMRTLSECVLAHQGVLVDYIGDELLAMWGAPEDQPEHAALACRAALDMLARLPELSARWQEALGRPIEVGIGISSGPARVGNIGSERKWKYGPLGNTVNLASRVQGATKFFRSKLLLTGDTLERLGPEFAPRRLCSVRVVNIDRPVSLYELAPPGPEWDRLRHDYEKALAEFEQGEFRQAARSLSNLQADYPDDGASLVLLSRAVAALVEGEAAFDKVWELPGK